MVVSPTQLTPSQHGFVKGRSIWDNIHQIQNVIQSPFLESTGLLAFLDMEKANDQAPTRCIAFADDCVVGFGTQEDKTAFREILSKYEEASNAKLNGAKSFSVAIGYNSFPLPYSPLFAIKPLDKPFRHLGVHFTSREVATPYSEDNLIRGITNRMAPWANRTASLAGKCVLINVFLLSKLWYLLHIIPFSDKFFNQLENIIQGWLWAPSRKHSAKISVLYGPKSKGGLGLINPRMQSRRILAKWIKQVVIPNSQEHWAMAARTIFATQLSLRNIEDNLALSRWLSRARRTGPRDLHPYWKGVLKAFRLLKWKVVFPWPSGPVSASAGPPVLVGEDKVPCSQYSLPKRPKHKVQLPELSIKILPRVQLVHDKKVYKYTWSSLVIPRIQSNTWRVMRRKYRIGLRQGETSPFLSCASCGEPVDSH
ncbi:hypothetical protein FRX31_024974, partial [Thalictrum thalictroides]